MSYFFYEPLYSICFRSFRQGVNYCARISLLYSAKLHLCTYIHNVPTSLVKPKKNYVTGKIFYV